MPRIQIPVLEPHKQVDSGLGFRCDEGILELVRLMNRFPGIKTEYSCQGSETHPKYDPAYVIFLGSFTDLKRFCLGLRPLITRTNEEHLSIMFQPDFMARETSADGISTPWSPSGGVRGRLQLFPTNLKTMVRRLRKLLRQLK